MAAAVAGHELSFDFDRAVDRAQTAPLPRLVVANVNSWNFTQSAFMHAHDPSEERKASVASIDFRPKTSHGILNRPKRQSFSRPLTSDGNKRNENIPPPPSLPPDFTSRFDPVAPASSIGLALGSPSGPGPELLSLNATAAAPAISPLAPATPTTSLNSASPALEPQPPPTKSKRWLGMGSLFRKKSPAPTAAGPERPKTATERPKTAIDRPRTAKDTSPSPPALANSPEPVEPPTPRRRSIGRRMSFGSGLRSKSKAENPPPMPPRVELERVKSKESNKRHDSGSSKASDAPVASTSPPDLLMPVSKPLLDVSIPQVKMDRFSILFQEVLSEVTSTGVPQTTHEAPKLNRAMSTPHERSERAKVTGTASRKPEPQKPDLAVAPTLQQRRKPQFEKLSPLNMHRLSSSPTFHQAPFAPKSAPSTYSSGSEPSFMPMPSPTIKRKPMPPSSAPSWAPPPPPSQQPRQPGQPLAPTVEKAPSVSSSSKPLAYSLFPKTETSPSLNAPSVFSDDKSLPDNFSARASVSDYGDHFQDPHPLRSSSLFPSDSVDAVAVAPSNRPLFPPSPPLSSEESPSIGTLHTLASPSYKSARSSFGSFGVNLAQSPAESSFPTGIEINVEDSHTGEQTIIGAFDFPGLLSPLRAEDSPVVDDSDMSIRYSNRSSAIGDSPVLGMSRSMSLSYSHETPRFLRRSESSNDESVDLSPHQDGLSEPLGRARTPTYVHVDDLEMPDEEELNARRRSMWGVMEDAHGPL